MAHITWRSLSDDGVRLRVRQVLLDPFPGVLFVAYDVDSKARGHRSIADQGKFRSLTGLD